MNSLPRPASGTDPEERTLHADDLKVPDYVSYRRADEETHKRLVTKTLNSVEPVRPIVVRPSQSDYYEVLVGLDALHAYREALPYAQIPVVSYHYKDAEAAGVALKAYIADNQLSLIEEAQAYKQVMDHFNWSANYLANVIHKPHPYAYNRVSLLDLPDDLQEFFKRGELGIEVGKKLIKKSLTNKQRRQLAEQALNNNVSTRSLGTRVNANRNKLSAPKMARQEQQIEKFVAYLEEQLLANTGTIALNQGEDGSTKQIAFNHSNLVELEGIVDQISAKPNYNQGLWQGTLQMSFSDLNELKIILKCLQPYIEWRNEKPPGNIQRGGVTMLATIKDEDHLHEIASSVSADAIEY